VFRLEEGVRGGGDRFVLKFEETSTNTGKIARGVPATNKRYTVQGVAVGRLDAARKIKEGRLRLAPTVRW
jgi:hypothetical protein